MCSIILFLLISVFVNYSNKNLLVFKKYAYDQNLKFTKITKLYNKYKNKYDSRKLNYILVGKLLKKGYNLEKVKTLVGASDL